MNTPTKDKLIVQINHEYRERETLKVAKVIAASLKGEVTVQYRDESKATFSWHAFQDRFQDI